MPDISDLDVQSALDYLRDNAGKAAMAKAHANYLSNYTKSLKAELMGKSDEKTAAAQERYAYSHPEYRKHLDVLKEAETEAYKHDFLLRAASEKIGVWRTQISFNKSMGELK
jgi:hypothetical protein